MNLLSLLWAVAEDLGSFAYESIRAPFVFPRSEHGDRSTPLLDAPKQHVALEAESETHKKRAVALPRTTTISARAPVGMQIAAEGGAEILERGRATLTALKEEHARTPLQKSTVMYTSSYATPLHSAPGMSGEVVDAILPYGSMVMVLSVDGMWAQVASGPHTGWVYVDDLEDCAADVYPAFRIGVANHADDPSTIRARAVIGDEFGAGEVRPPQTSGESDSPEVGLPLQAEEYVLYRLARRGVRIEWPQVRPRTPGKWHEILKENSKVKVVPRPVAGVLMEFLMESEDDEGVAGHIAYVEAVFPDDTIQISEANWPDRGIYNERVLTLPEWQALTPTFLAVT